MATEGSGPCQTQPVVDAPKDLLPPPPQGSEAVGPAAEADQLPVVARLMVEIRSDGTRTVARGALEDVASGQRTAVEASGGTPMALAASLARTIFSARTLARKVVRKLLPGREP
jgi:hypothetical protein